MAKFCKKLKWLVFFWDTVYRSQTPTHNKKAVLHRETTPCYCNFDVFGLVVNITCNSYADSHLSISHSYSD